jgi:hypothetical protein
LIDTGSEFLKEEKKLRELLVLSVDLGTYNIFTLKIIYCNVVDNRRRV